MAASTLITANNIGKSYSANSSNEIAPALKSVSFSIQSDDFVSITGPSGCGKSTLLSILSLIEVPSHGTLDFLGLNVLTLGFNEKAKIRNRFLGLVFQSFNLLGDHTATENVLLPNRFSLTPIKDARLRAELLLEKVGLKDKMRAYPSTLSGGEQQRVAVARALMMQPRIILADEPTGNLDQSNSMRLLELFQDIHSTGTAFVIVTHDPQIAREARRQLVMSDGSFILPSQNNQS